jgi:hypothetical protein
LGPQRRKGFICNIITDVPFACRLLVLESDENLMNNTAYAAIRSKLVFACGSKVLTHFDVCFSRSQSVKNKHQ